MPSAGSNSGASSCSATAYNPVCIKCVEHDAIENFHAAGAFHASKSKLNT